MKTILIGKLEERDQKICFSIKQAYTVEKGFTNDPEYTNLMYLASLDDNPFGDKTKNPKEILNSILTDPNNKEVEIHNSYVRKYTYNRDILGKYFSKTVAICFWKDGFNYKENKIANYTLNKWFSYDYPVTENLVIGLNDDYEIDLQVVEQLNEWLKDEFCIEVGNKDKKETVHSILEYLQYVFSARDTQISKQAESQESSINYKNGVPSAEDYSDKEEQIYYICKYAYAYSYMYYEAYSKILKDWPEELSMRVLSMGCGPFIDGFGLKYAQYYYDEKSIEVSSYIGIDGADWTCNGFCFCAENGRYMKSDVNEYLSGLESIDANVLVFPFFLTELNREGFDALKNNLKKLSCDDIKLLITLKYTYRGVDQEEVKRAKELVSYLTSTIDNPYKLVEEKKDEHRIFERRLSAEPFNYGNYPPNIYAWLITKGDRRDPALNEKYIQYRIYSLKRVKQ